MKKILRKVLPNPFDHLLKKAQKARKKKFLLAWNRGLGDIPLGLYAIVTRIRKYIPDATITFVTRDNLREGFSLLQGIDVLATDKWQRGVEYNIPDTLAEFNLSCQDFDVVIEKPDPTYWVAWQRKTLTPQLHWDKEKENIYQKFSLPQEKGIAVHPFAETNYGLWRNWPKEHWQELFSSIDQPFFVFGHQNLHSFTGKNVIDLRGKTSLFALLSIIKNCCHTLIAPDSGILSMVYYLNETFPIKVISLWAQPHHGILKQGVASPNALLAHIPLIAPENNLQLLSVCEVIKNL